MAFTLAACTNQHLKTNDFETVAVYCRPNLMLSEFL